MAAASSSSSSSSSSSDSLPPWIILNRVANVWDEARQEDPDEAAVELSFSPTFSTLSVARSIHPDRENFDHHPYIVAYDAGGLLLHISISPSIGINFSANPSGSFVVVPVRAFVPDMANKLVMSAGSAIRVPERLSMPAVASIKNIGLLSRPGSRDIEYLVAELQSVDDADGSTASLLRFRSGSAAWVEEKLQCIGFNPRCVHEVISHDGKLWWVDLGKGLVSCSPFEDHPVLVYQDLPNGVARRDRDGQWAWNDIERKRCVTVSSGMLRFVELIDAETNADTGETTVTMWTLVVDPEDGSTSWIREFKNKISKIWEDCAYKKSRLPMEIPVLAIVHPKKAEVLYCFIGGILCSVDVPEHRLLKVITNFSPFSQVYAWNEGFALPPLSWRYLIAWEISNSEENHLCTTFAENVILSDDARRRSLTRICRQGVKMGKILAYHLGVTVSSMGSNLLYLNEELSDTEKFFKHMSEFKASGHSYAATAARKSAKASKKISKLVGGAGSALSYGGIACSSLGFCLQKLHPKAQTGGPARFSITEEITIESMKEATDVIKEWSQTGEVVIADVPQEMDTDLAKEIMKQFQEAGALVLVENSPILREKAAKVLDDEWHMV